MSWLDECSASETDVAPIRVVRRRREPHFHGRMSARSLFEAGRRGRNALMTFLVLWYYQLWKKWEWVELHGDLCRNVGLNAAQRQSGIAKLQQPPALIQLQDRRSGCPVSARAIDPWPPGEDQLYFRGFMSFRCLSKAYGCSKGGALLAYLLIYHEFSLSGQASPVRLGWSKLAQAGLTRASGNRAINALLAAGLVEVMQRQSGRTTLVAPIDPWPPDGVRQLAGSSASGRAGSMEFKQYG
jgi:hypothetical protein